MSRHNLSSAVFLDRDGVVNPPVFYSEWGFDSPTNCDHLELYDDVSAAIKSVRQTGYQVVLISNQPGIAKGKYSWPAFQLIDDRLTQLLERDGAWLDARYYCFHHPEATVPELRISCECRKPLPGLLLTAARELSIDLETSFFVGDTDRDVLAGKAAGCQPIRIVRDRDFKFDDGVPTMRNLHQAVNYIAGRRSVHVA